jgi:hypothetical protein
MLAGAPRDGDESGHAFAFVAVILDCIDPAARAFYRRWDFQERPGQPARLFIPWARLTAMMENHPPVENGRN